MNLLRTPRLLTLLLAPSLVPACTPGKLCIGDCIDSPAIDDSSGDAPSTGESPGASETGIGSTSETGVQPTTDATNPTSTDDTGTDQQEGCGLADSFDPLAGCGDGVQNPGEFCFIESFGTVFPAGIDSTLAGAFDGGSTDLLVSNGAGNLTIQLDGSDPDVDLSQHDWGVELPPGRLVLTAVGDFDEDGHLDAVARNETDDGDAIRLMLVDGDGSLKGGSNFLVNDILFGPVAVDWDQDGHLDLVLITPGDGNPENVLLLRGDGVTNFADEPQFGFTTTADMRFAVGALGPVDGVADDFVFAHADGGEFTIMVRAPGDLLLSFNLGETAHIHQVEIADVDSDGRGDVVILADTDGIVPFLHVFLQAGPADDPTFELNKKYRVVCEATTFALGDIDGDGALDAVAGGPGDPNVTIRRGDGQGGLDAVLTRDITVAPDQLRIADFTGNGFADIVSVNNAAASVSIASNTP